MSKPEVFHLAYDIKDPDGKIIKVVDNLPVTINSELINGNHLSCNGVFIRKDISSQFPFSEKRELSASEDYALWLKLASRFPIYCISTVTSSIINHHQRSVLNINLKSFIQRMEALKDELLSDERVQDRYKKNWEDFMAYRDIYIALHLAMARFSKTASLRYLYFAMKLKPGVIFTRRFMGALKNILF